MRNFLKDVNIWGATLVSHGDELLHYTIPCLLEYCDKILLMQDNVSDATKKIVNDYKNRYPDIIELAETGFAQATPTQEEGSQGQLKRFKSLQGEIREKVFEYLREVHKEKPVDILLFPDEDEIFSDYLPELLKEFWSKEDIKGVTIKPIDVFGDMKTVTGRSMTGHTRILKFFPELTALPYRTGCYYRPLTKLNRIGCKFYTIHLCNLQTDRFKWRVKHWRKGPQPNWGLWKLPEDIRKIRPEKVKEIIRKDPDCTVEEFLRGGDKRAPVGANNANMALYEASKVLDELGVRHFLAFGTALGVYRDKALVKWDWDVDLICLGEDIEKIDNGVKQLTEAGFAEFKRKQDIPKWKKEDGSVSEDKYVRTYSFKKYGVRVDVDPAYISSDEKSRIILKGRKREQFCAMHPEEWFANVRRVKYGNYEYGLPTPIEEYLKSNYGDGWNVPAYGPMPWSQRECKRDYWEIK